MIEEQLPKLLEIGALGMINVIILFKLVPRIDDLSKTIDDLSKSVDKLQAKVEVNQQQFISIDAKLNRIEHILLGQYQPQFKTRYPVPPDVVG